MQVPSHTKYNDLGDEKKTITFAWIEFLRKKMINVCGGGGVFMSWREIK